MFKYFRERRESRERMRSLTILPISERLIEMTARELLDYSIDHPFYHQLEMVSALTQLRQKCTKVSLVTDSDKVFYNDLLGEVFLYLINADNAIRAPLNYGHVRPNPYDENSTILETNKKLISVFLFAKRIIELDLSLKLLSPYIVKLQTFIGEAALISLPTKEQISKVLLENGFKVKDQGDGVMDLNPYVYEAVFKLIDSLKVK